MTDHSLHRASQVVKAGEGFATGDGWFGRLVSAGPDRLLRQFDRYLKMGMITVTLPGGQVRRIGGHAPGPHAVVTLHNWRPIRRLIAGGSTAFARSYIEGDWDAVDLADLFHLFAANRNTVAASVRGTVWSRMINQMKHTLRENHLMGSQANIGFHYDLGNAFYREWLDPSMTYSSAIYGEGDNSLEQAQTRKIRRLLDLLGVKPGDHILEIGCGWGGFAEIAARDYQARVTGITLSTEQLAYARERIEKAGLSDRVHFELIDYRHVEGQFDHVASVEMFEAVGEKYWRTFMDKVHAVLKPGGKAALQIITIDEAMFEAYRRGADFIQTYIFPGGMLPSVERLRKVADSAQLMWERADGFGQHYARTLREWLVAFEAAFEAGRLPPGFDDTFRRIWRYYLTYCEGGFRGESIDVQQIVLAKARG
jgi:cyclopropane-fatty-acyl-phospholipid synthase